MIDEYIRKKDAVNALDRIFDNVPMELTTEILRLRRELRGLPSADVVQVVRCKDCKHYYFADNRIPQEQRYVCEISGEIWRPDSFCSYGERREGVSRMNYYEAIEFLSKNNIYRAIRDLSAIAEERQSKTAKRMAELMAEKRCVRNFVDSNVLTAEEKVDAIDKVTGEE